MKKGVIAVLLLFLIPLALAESYVRETGSSKYNPTGMQTLDISSVPAPPAPPGFSDETTTQTTSTQSTSSSQTTTSPPQVQTPAPTAFEQQLAQANTLDLQSRVVRLETQYQSSANVVSRIDALESRVSSLEVDVGNLRQASSRPNVEYAASTGVLDELRSSIKNNAILSLSLACLALLMIIGVIFTAIVEKKHARKENKEVIKTYLSNYEKSGYDHETLRMHLRACGWKDEFVDEAERELPENI